MPDRPPPWWLSASATVVVALAKLLLTRLRTTTVLTALAGADRSRLRGRVDPDQAATSVATAARILRAECLPQAVALAALLQRGGASPTVVLGCRFYGENSWGAHAWVEVDGRRFDPLAGHEHAELGRLSAAGRWRVEGA